MYRKSVKCEIRSEEEGTRRGRLQHVDDGRMGGEK